MTLKSYQTTLSTGRLYEVTLLGGVSGLGDTLNPSIWANAGISIYGSESATEPANLAAMTLDTENTDVTGNLVLARGVSVIPRYIAITGAATEIIASGLEVRDIKAIS